MNTVMTGKPIPEFVDKKMVAEIWQDLIKTANKHNKPGKFTAFIGIEWSSNGPKGYQNLHRNTIYRGDTAVDECFTTFDSLKPEDLWTFNENARKQGFQLLAIPHNPNYSDGLMFRPEYSDGQPIDRAYAERRMVNEPLVEIMQCKGASETHPLLSPDDEFAGFEISDFVDGFEAIGKPGRAQGTVTCGMPTRWGWCSRNNSASTRSSSGSSVRRTCTWGPSRTGKTTSSALWARWTILPETAADPWRVGQHDQELGPFRPGRGLGRGEHPRIHLGRPPPQGDVRHQRHRIHVRFFGGWDYKSGDDKGENFAKTGYDKGVPMGGDLAVRPDKAKAPTFLVWAEKDPDGANLDRIQIIKGWAKHGQSFEKIYNVAWSGGRSLDPKTGRLAPGRQHGGRLETHLHQHHRHR